MYICTCTTFVSWLGGRRRRTSRTNVDEVACDSACSPPSLPPRAPIKPRGLIKVNPTSRTTCNAFEPDTDDGWLRVSTAHGATGARTTRSTQGGGEGQAHGRVRGHEKDIEQNIRILRGLYNSYRAGLGLLAAVAPSFK